MAAMWNDMEWWGRLLLLGGAISFLVLVVYACWPDPLARDLKRKIANPPDYHQLALPELYSAAASSPGLYSLLREMDHGKRYEASAPPSHPTRPETADRARWRAGLVKVPSTIPRRRGFRR